MNTLFWISRYPEGDKEPFLQEVRKQLPTFTKPPFQIKKYSIHTGFTREALNFLA